MCALVQGPISKETVAPPESVRTHAGSALVGINKCSLTLSQGRFTLSTVQQFSYT